MGVDVHGADATKAARRAVSDAIRHSSLPLLREIRDRGGEMLVDVVVGLPDPRRRGRRCRQGRAAARRGQRSRRRRRPQRAGQRHPHRLRRHHR